MGARAKEESNAGACWGLPLKSSRHVGTRRVLLCGPLQGVLASLARVATACARLHLRREVLPFPDAAVAVLFMEEQIVARVSCGVEIDFFTAGQGGGAAAAAAASGCTVRHAHSNGS